MHEYRRMRSRLPQRHPFRSNRQNEPRLYPRKLVESQLTEPRPKEAVRLKCKGIVPHRAVKRRAKGFIRRSIGIVWRRRFADSMNPEKYTHVVPAKLQHLAELRDFEEVVRESQILLGETTDPSEQASLLIDGIAACQGLNRLGEARQILAKLKRLDIPDVEREGETRGTDRTVPFTLRHLT